MIASKLHHVTAKRPCPVCDKPDWCSVSANGEVVICMRVEQGAHKPSKNGGWVHLQADPTRPSRGYTAPLRIIAPASRRHVVYTALLERLPLIPRHWTHLQEARLLSEDTITRCQFATVPARRQGDEIATELSREYDLTNVPGFFWKENKPRLRFAGVPGFFIPIRDHEGMVSALQIRRDSADADPRYLLVSSADLTGGASSGAPPHFARPWQVRDALLITEGALKAEVIAEDLQRPVCGLVAVGTFDQRFGWKLRDKFPRLRRAGIAYDMEDNEATARQKERLIKTLKEAGLEVEVFEGPAEEGKGLDDFLIAKKRAAMSRNY
jgi:hypothetical protein